MSVEVSQVILNHGLTFLAVATGIVVVVVAGFLVKLLVDLSTLAKNIKTADDFKTTIWSVADTKKLYDNITPQQAINILKTDKTYSLENNNELLDKADEFDTNLVDWYLDQRMTYKFSSANENWIISLVKELQSQKLDNDVIKSYLEKAWVFNREEFKSWLFKDWSWYNKLQDLWIL